MSTQLLAGPAGPVRPGARLLLLSYHFPPGQAVGGLRWQMLATHAAERGWAMDIITVHPDSLPHPDASRLAQLPSGTRVFGTPLRRILLERIEDGAAALAGRFRRRPAPRPAATSGTPAAGATRPAAPGSYGREDVRWRPSRPRDWLRAFYAYRVNAKEFAWSEDAARLGDALFTETRYAAVISCGPPHMVHESARRLAHRHGVPFVMDMRDPWRLVQRLPEVIASPMVYWLAGRFEPRAVAAARQVVTNTEPAAEQLRRLYPAAAGRILSVMNGYDDDPMPPSVHGERFVLGYAGTIYLDRDPRPLFQAAAAVVRELKLTPGQFGIEMIGNVENYGGVPVSRIAEQEGLAAYVSTGPARPRAEAMRFLASATMLVSLPQDSDLAIPSKIFEYLRFRAWILVLAEPGSAAARAVEGTSVDTAGSTDIAAISSVLRRRVQAFLEGERPGEPTGIASLSRRHQAERLFTALETAIGRPEERPTA